jgi:hypothetical protein
VDFGGQDVLFSVSEVIVATNTGTADCPVGASTLTAAGEAAFTVVEPVATSLGGGESISFVVTFTPPDYGSYGAELVVGLPGDPVVALAGEGLGSGLVADPAALNLGTVTVGESVATTLTLQSVGNVALTVTAIGVEGDEGLEVDGDALGPLPWTLEVLELAEVTVTWTPAAATVLAGATVTVTSDDPTDPELTVPVSGEAI